MKQVIIEHTLTGEHWTVPYGFGQVYKDQFNARPSTKQILAALNRIGYDTTAEDVDSWALRKRLEAFIYAMREHVAASDNPVQRHPKPAWLAEVQPWQDPDPDPLWGPKPTRLPLALHPVPPLFTQLGINEIVLVAADSVRKLHYFRYDGYEYHAPRLSIPPGYFDKVSFLNVTQNRELPLSIYRWALRYRWAPSAADLIDDRLQGAGK